MIGEQLLLNFPPFPPLPPLKGTNVSKKASAVVAAPKLSATRLKIVELISIQMIVDETEVTPGTRLSEDLNADSMDFVELTMVLEDEFNIEIDDEAAEKLLTVESIFKYVEKHAKKIAA